MILHTTCETLPLAIFIDCVVDGAYEKLGEGTDEQRQDAWLNILSEYHKLSGGSTAVIQQQGQAVAISSKLQIVKMAVAQLLETPSDALIAVLKSRKYNVRDYNTDFEGYTQDLQRIIGQIQSEEHRLKMLLDDLAPKEEGKKITRKDFIRQLHDISKVEGYKVNDDILVVEYCDYLERLKIHYETLKAVGHGR